MLETLSEERECWKFCHRKKSFQNSARVRRYFKILVRGRRTLSVIYLLLVRVCWKLCQWVESYRIHSEEGKCRRSVQVRRVFETLLYGGECWNSVRRRRVSVLSHLEESIGNTLRESRVLVTLSEWKLCQLKVSFGTLLEGGEC